MIDPDHRERMERMSKADKEKRGNYSRPPPMPKPAPSVDPNVQRMANALRTAAKAFRALGQTEWADWCEAQAEVAP